MDKHVTEDFRKIVATELSTLITYLPAIVPINDNDEKILNLGLDMLTELRNDLVEGDYNTLSQILDLDAISEEWATTYSKFMHVFSSEVYDAQRELEERYVVYDDEE